ncbi:MAG TPA: sugar ABC transporter permease [Candidatus Eisenbergiella intestinipullorum]|nr:sugar ABC transporter permease [Candidatus Eisenbergiella intestinipullorum]
MKALKTIKKTEGQRRKEQKNIRIGYLFIFPVVIGLVVFTVIPFFYSLYLAFTDYNGLNAPDWVGLQNFATMFWEDDKFWLSFKITLKFAIVQVPLKLIFALLVALLLSRGSKGVGAYRVAFYVPSVLGGSVAVAMTWKILWGVNGPVNGLLNLFGIEPVNFLKDTRTALYVLILLGVWQFGSSMLIFLAGIKDIPQIYYEAAIMDGANSVQRFLKITLPLLTPCIFFNLVNGIIGSLQAFNSAYLVTNGGPLNSTLYYGLNLYNQAFNYGKFGYASAMAWFMLLIIVALTALVFRSSSGWVFYQNDQD